MWDKIGIEVEIVSEDAIIWQDRVETGNFTGSIFDYSTFHGFVFPSLLKEILFYETWVGEYTDRFEELVEQAMVETDKAVTDALYKEAAVIAIDDCRGIPILQMVEGWYWWPWVVDHYQVNFTGDNLYIGPVAYMWLDPDLKDEMGF